MGMMGCVQTNNLSRHSHCGNRILFMAKKPNRPIRLQWGGQPLLLARFGTLGFILLMSYASLDPFEFKFDTPVQFWDWMFAPMPKYVTLFDILANILGYIPFGFLMIFALFPKVTKWPAWGLTLLAGMLLSGSLESLQTWLPTRVASNLDWWMNSFGTLIGGLFALPFKPIWLSGGALDRYRLAWFGQRSSFFLLFLLFPWAQIYPQNAWLGMGDLGFDFLRISQYWHFPIANTSQETLITSLATLSTGSLFLYGMATKGPRLRLFASLLLATIIFKCFSLWLQYGLDHVFDWVTYGTLIGFSLGGLLLYWVSKLSHRSHWWIAFCGLTMLVVCVNVMPQSPYFLAEVELWPQGRLTHFNGLLEWGTWIWPTLAIYNLLRIGLNKSKPSNPNITWPKSI